MIPVSDDTQRRLAVAALVGHCEAIAASGLLPEPSEVALRYLIAQALAAHGMPARSEFPRTLETA